MLKKILMLSVLFCAVMCFAQSVEIKPADIKIKTSLVAAPKYQAFLGYPQFPHRSGAGASGKWLMVIVEYIPRGNATQYFQIQKLLTTLYIILPAANGRKILLTGTQELADVLVDNQVHRVMFIIPPSFLIKNTQLGTGKALRSVGDAVCCMAVFKDGASQLARSYSRARNGKSREAEFTAFVKNNQKPVSGVILPKEHSPWQWVDCDEFDYPASMMEGALK